MSEVRSARPPRRLDPGYTPGPAKAIWRRWGLEKVVSGGQSGVDRAVLDVALQLGLPCGGWCPRGRWAEDGPLDARYPLRETPHRRTVQRTLWNMRDSDGTLILARNRPRGGSAVLPRLAGADRPRIMVNPEDGRAPARAIRFVTANGIGVLNVGGPRESEDPGIHLAARAFLLRLFAPCWRRAEAPAEHEPEAGRP